ncbi:MAG: hypothetical protein JWN84_3544 [Nocardioides sp.]|nr:hypothetical protein [Nocardioides sp.]
MTVMLPVSPAPTVLNSRTTTLRAVPARPGRPARATVQAPDKAPAEAPDSAPNADRVPPDGADMLRLMSHALADLASSKSLEQLVDRVPTALCRVGFDRAMVSRVADAHWVVERFHSEVDPAGAALITEAARNEPLLLNPSILELEMVRRRVAILVPDVSREPRVHPQLAEMTRSSSYVAAPIMPHGEVVGFLHADRLDGRPVTAFDREVITLFAHHFSALVRTAWLEESFKRLRGTVDHLRESLGGMVEGCVRGDVGLARQAEEAVSAGAAPGQHLAQSMLVGSPGVDELLSTREREVLRLMAVGETNTRIASRLVISEGTVKSHVRHILRKLNASNRAEAVCRWLQKPA